MPEVPPLWTMPTSFLLSLAILGGASTGGCVHDGPPLPHINNGLSRTQVVQELGEPVRTVNPPFGFYEGPCDDAAVQVLVFTIEDTAESRMEMAVYFNGDDEVACSMYKGQLTSR